MKTNLIQFVLLCLLVACSTSETVVQDAEEPAEAQESISLSINEAVQFDFEKIDGSWDGELTIYTLSSNDEKVVQSRYTAAQDSSWEDFGLFVDYLELYEIPPQHKIVGWVPDSGKMPKRVYAFEIFTGDSTRTFSYQDPMNDLRDYWQSQNVLTFVTFVQNDLNWVEVSRE